jgi:hypothetical protein
MTQPDTSARSITMAMEQTPGAVPSSTAAAVTPPEHAHIPGWGADKRPEDRPAFPMERTPPRGLHVHWERAQQQPQTVEILKSTERPAITPVFGTTVPPSGLSGVLRRLAFRFSENDVRRWMTLLLADRINVVEGLLQDLSRGHVPNVLGEMGWRAELKHNPKGAARKAITVVAVAGLGCWLLSRRGDRRPSRRR